MSLTAKTRKWLNTNAHISLKGKTVVVTGSDSGIGFKTADTMLYLGANVIMACRNQQKAACAQKALAADYPERSISVIPLDLADFSSIDSFVSNIREQRIDIDVFVNNAGVFHQPGRQTKDGFELVIGTNYLGVYYLTEKLLTYLSSLPHRVTYINTISLIHKYARIDFDDFFHSKRYGNLAVYATSKLCLAKYTYYKAMQLEGSNVCIIMNHPGIALTPLGLNAVGPKVARLEKVFRYLFNSIEKSALSTAYILANPIPAGSIVGPDRLCCGWGYPKVNHTCQKVKTGAEELIAFTENLLMGSKF